MSDALTLQEAVVLDALCETKCPLGMQMIQDRVSLHAGDGIDRKTLSLTLSDLIERGYVHHVYGLPEIRFEVTVAGRARYIGQEAKSAFDGPPIEHEPAQALICLDEDELDGWWDALDVEAKADAFVQWSLGNDGRNSHIYIEPGIPVIDTIGGTTHPQQKPVERVAADQAAQQ